MADSAESGVATEGWGPMRPAIFACMTLVAAIALGLSLLELVSLTLAARAVKSGGSGLETAARLSPLNWDLRFILGEVASAAGRPEVASRWYGEAIARNPACAECAVGLAEVESRLGNDPDPWLERAVRYGRSTASVRVRAGTLYARLGRHEEAARQFAAGALGQRENQREFFALLHRIYPDYVVLDHIIPDQIIPAYFGFARASLGPFAMQRVWERYQRVGLGPDARQEYVAYLLRHGLAHQAWSVWFDGDPPPLGKLLNGDFEARPTNTGFSWRIADGEGVEARIVDCPDCVDRGRALVLRFDGETDAHYSGTRIYVPVKPSTVYRLAARVKSDAITSARGPMLAVAGLKGAETDASHACELWVAGEELRRTFDWRSTSLIFSVPAACEGIQVLVTRLRARRLDKFIGGELWVDDVVLEEMLSSPPPASGEPMQQGALGATIGALSEPAASPQAEIDARPRQEGTGSLVDEP
jgi:tetratricopeptide (TPR) repeat protein